MSTPEASELIHNVEGAVSAPTTYPKHQAGDTPLEFQLFFYMMTTSI